MFTEVFRYLASALFLTAAAIYGVLLSALIVHVLGGSVAR